jgi:hypothetical protein
VNDITCSSTFEIPATPSDAWRALEEIRVERADPSKGDEWWFPGFECRAVEIDRDEPRRLTVRKGEQPCLDSIIEITFEHSDTGSIVHVTQSGFDQAFVDMAGESFWRHAENIFADLHVFFATGVIAGRAWLPWASLGIAMRTQPEGVRVDTAWEGSWASRIGLREGDLLCTVHGAPIFTSGDLAILERVVHAGDEVSAAWIRDGERHEAHAIV